MRFQIARILGIPVYLDWTWFIIVFILASGLATGTFRPFADEFGAGLVVLMGLAAALALFLSILLHEFGHAIVARRNQIPIAGITLFIFGGVAEMEEEPRSPGAEFRVAAAGPLVSILIAVICAVVFAQLAPDALEAAGAEEIEPERFVEQMGPLAAVFYYLAAINIILVLFNSVPAFPLDGGRILRSIVWKISGNYARSTKVTAACGMVFGGILIAYALLVLVETRGGGGWILGLVGLFLFSVARTSYRRADQPRAGVDDDQPPAS